MLNSGNFVMNRIVSESLTRLVSIHYLFFTIIFRFSKNMLGSAHQASVRIDITALLTDFFLQFYCCQIYRKLFHIKLTKNLRQLDRHCVFTVKTGVGLWPGSVDIEFRGAVFTTGGDANIDGLVTFASECFDWR